MINERPRVATFKSSLLPWSETFILEQASSFTRWNNRLFGHTRRANGLSLGIFPSDILWPNGIPLWAKLVNMATFRTYNSSLAAQRMRRFAPDLIHIHFGTEAFCHWRQFRGFDIPIIVTLHGRDITVHAEEWESGRLGAGMKTYPKGLRTIANDSRISFVAVSSWIRQAAIDFGIPAEKILVHPIGVDVERFTPADSKPLESPTILFVGRFVEKKGVQWLLRATQILQQSIPGTQLVLIGDGPMRDELVTLATTLGVDANFLGSQPPDVVLEWMRKATLLCLPSVTAADGDAEGLPIVLLEAQSCGLPAVTSAKGGRDEAIEDGVTGFAFAERDVEGLTKAMTRILLDQELRQRMSRAARERMLEHFDLRACTRALELSYDGWMQRHVSRQAPL